MEQVRNGIWTSPTIYSFLLCSSLKSFWGRLPGFSCAVGVSRYTLINVGILKMSVRRRGENKQANGHANGSVAAADNVVDQKTDHTRWRLRNDDGRQTWHYLESDEELKAWPMTAADKYFLGMDTVSFGNGAVDITSKAFPEFDILSRAQNPCLHQQHHSKQPRMALHFTHACSSSLEIGAASTADPCSYSQAW